MKAKNNKLKAINSFNIKIFFKKTTSKKKVTKPPRERITVARKTGKNFKQEYHKSKKPAKRIETIKSQKSN